MASRAVSFHVACMLHHSRNRKSSYWGSSYHLVYPRCAAYANEAFGCNHRMIFESKTQRTKSEKKELGHTRGIVRLVPPPASLGTLAPVCTRLCFLLQIHPAGNKLSQETADNQRHTKHYSARFPRSCNRTKCPHSSSVCERVARFHVSSFAVQSFPLLALKTGRKKIRAAHTGSTGNW